MAVTEELQQAIIESAKTAFIDASIRSQEQYLPSMVYNDPSKGQVVLSTLEYELNHCLSFSISVAFITSGGISTIYNSLRSLESKGIRGRIITTDFLTFNDPRALRQLLKFKNVDVRVSEKDLHTKGYFFHKSESDTILVGSSNLTDRALKCNVEWNVRLSSVSQGDIVSKYLSEYERLWEESKPLTEEWIASYEERFTALKAQRIASPGYRRDIIKPTETQSKAIESIEKLRRSGEKRALLISATGTGKTYISAFAVKEANPGKVLFMVHREKILKDAMESYKNVLGENGRRYGIYTGTRKERDCDCMFASVNSLSRHLGDFDRREFDYIVCDEAHHIVTSTERSILDYFQPKFILGMTATPERSDGPSNVYEAFDFNVPYEIRLSGALEEELVCPFHYFGIDDLTVDGKDRRYRDLGRLEMDERVRHLVDQLEAHPFSGDVRRGLIFCSGIKEALDLESRLKDRYLVKALIGKNSEDEREEWFDRLEKETSRDIFLISVDILNEGVDLPRVNTVVMMRPTESSIVFIQQLGRGLRKRPDKEYVLVLDFIGNYDNNYKIPVALFGDNSCSKDSLRRKMMAGNRIIPGASTVSFDEVSRERIFESINRGGFSQLRELKASYQEVCNKIGRDPTLMDLYLEKSLDPRVVVSLHKSLNTFRNHIRSASYVGMPPDESSMLEYLSHYIVNGMRPHEAILLRMLMRSDSVTVHEFMDELQRFASEPVDKAGAESAVKVLSGTFDKKLVKTPVCRVSDGLIVGTDGFRAAMSDPEFVSMAEDVVETGLQIFDDEYRQGFDYGNNMSMFKRYSREQVSRMFNFDTNLESTLFGYRIVGNYCPLFVTYRKVEGDNPQYNDHFIDNRTFYWESRHPRNLRSNEIQPLLGSNANGLRVMLFVQKDGSEGTDFYYCGQVHLRDGTARDAFTLDRKMEKQPVVSMEFDLEQPVDSEIYHYLTSELSIDE